MGEDRTAPSTIFGTAADAVLLAVDTAVVAAAATEMAVVVAPSASVLAIDSLRQAALLVVALLREWCKLERCMAETAAANGERNERVTFLERKFVGRIRRHNSSNFESQTRLKRVRRAPRDLTHERQYGEELESLSRYLQLAEKSS
jgi:hypothetical protein